MKVTTITISAKDAAAYMENTNSLFKALWELTDLIREESKLKQHHRAYLHVRDNIDEKVKEAREIMFKVSGDMLRTAFESKEHEETADCEECVCSDCPRLPELQGLSVLRQQGRRKRHTLCRRRG